MVSRATVEDSIPSSASDGLSDNTTITHSHAQSVTLS
jgi:hypothetical protein